MWQVSGRSDITDFEEVVRLDKELCFVIDSVKVYLPSYDEKLNYIKEAERMNSSQITKSEMADVFELSEQQVNDIAMSKFLIFLDNQSS